MWTRIVVALLLMISAVGCSFGGHNGGGGGHGARNAIIDLNADVTVDNQPDSPNLTFTLGTNATLHFTATDVGNKPSDQLITLTATLPAGISYVSSASVNGNWTCSASGQTITCTSSFSVPGLTNGLAIITMNVSVANNAQGPAQLSVSISTPDGSPNTNGGAKGVNFVAQGGGGGGGGGTNALCQPQGSESALKGAWVFLEEGENGNLGHMAVGATFVADGSGGITSASWDLALPFVYPITSYTADPSSNNTGSSYSLDSSGRGCLALVDRAANTKNIFHIAMSAYSNGAPTSGYVMDATPSGDSQGSSSGFYAAGLIVPGATSVTNATLNGSYVFGLAGRGDNPNCGGASCPAPISAAGNITFDGNGGINTATTGLGDSDIGSVGVSTHQAIAAGSYNLGSNGRGTISFTDGSVPIKGVIYLATNGGSVFFLSQTAITGLNNSPPAIVAGRGIHFGGMGASPNAVLAGQQLLAITSANAATVGIGTLVPSNANATDGTVTGTLWQAGGGASQSVPINGTYTVTDAAFGRVTLTGIGNNPPVLYSNGGNSGLDGFFVGTNGAADTGRMVFQSASATNYSDANFSSGFKAVFNQFERDIQTNQYVVRLGQITFDGTGGFSGSYDENGPNGLLTNQAINANYGVNTDGSGFFEQNTWPWVSRIDHSYYIDENSGNQNPLVNDVTKQ